MECLWTKMHQPLTLCLYFSVQQLISLLHDLGPKLMTSEAKGTLRLC